jgi:capsular polysaccharide biosynthesis protein
VRNGAFAFALSLVAGIAVALLLARLDRRLQDPDEGEAVYGYEPLPAAGVMDHVQDHEDGVDGRAI